MALKYTPQDLSLRKKKTNPRKKYEESVDEVIGKIYEELEVISSKDIQTLVLEGTTAASTSQAIYGINLITTSTIIDLATRLPDPIAGQQTIFINNSSLPIYVFPSTSGGEINGVIDGSASIPPDGRTYSFYCIENPLPGAWVWSPPATAQIEIQEMSIAHTQGIISAPDTDDYNVGLGGANFPGAGMGYGGGILFTGDWRTEAGSAIISKVKCYTNIVWADLVTTGSQVASSVLQGYQSGLSGVYFGINHPIHFFGTQLNPGSFSGTIQEVTGGPAYAGEVGDVGTLYLEQLGGGGSVREIIGDNYTQNIPDIFSNGFYTFGMFITAPAATKTYKFKWFVEYY